MGKDFSWKLFLKREAGPFFWLMPVNSLIKLQIFKIFVQVYWFLVNLLKFDFACFSYSAFWFSTLTKLVNTSLRIVKRLIELWNLNSYFLHLFLRFFLSHLSNRMPFFRVLSNSDQLLHVFLNSFLLHHIKKFVSKFTPSL